MHGSDETSFSKKKKKKVLERKQNNYLELTTWSRLDWTGPKLDQRVIIYIYICKLF